MKKALFTAVAAALTASACAQMPLPLADQSAPAQVQAPQCQRQSKSDTVTPGIGNGILIHRRVVLFVLTCAQFGATSLLGEAVLLINPARRLSRSR